MASYDHVIAGVAERASLGNQAATRQRRWLAILLISAEWLLLIAGAGYFCGRTLPRAWQYLNTDFPNYYVTASLLRRGYDTTRLYDWLWIQRQKDHLGIDKSQQALVGYVPLTPFSSLAVWPLTRWSPLAAKRVWIVLNLLLAAALAVLLQSLSCLGMRRIVLLMLLCYPLHRNFLYGQLYLLLLLIIALSLWLYVHEQRVASGLLLGIGFGLKIFPIFFLLYFLRKKDYRAAAAVGVGSVATILASVAAFGIGLNRIYFLQVLPWALRGEGADPYRVSASSISALLHHLFIYEPSWNPQPLVHAPQLFAILHPLLQMLVLAPALLLVVPGKIRTRQVCLEWAAFLIALLTISTLPASYHFTLIILPTALMAAYLINNRCYRALAVLLGLFWGICFPWAAGERATLLSIPRLCLMLVLCLFAYQLLARREQRPWAWDRDRGAWLGALACVMVIQIVAGVRHQRGIYEHYANRIAGANDAFLATEPTALQGKVNFIAMVPDGYRVAGDTTFENSAADQLAITSAGNRRWIEESLHTSRIVSTGEDGAGKRLEVEDAEFPVASPDGKWLAYLRSRCGISQLWIRNLQHHEPDRALTPSHLNVWEMSFLPDGSLIVAASTRNGLPGLYSVNGSGDLRQISSTVSRYPSASPDGHWLTYSRQQGGAWNLWLRNLRTGAEERISDAPCNDVSPSWLGDSRTLLYASDCGRVYGLTALYRRVVVR